MASSGDLGGQGSPFFCPLIPIRGLQRWAMAGFQIEPGGKQDYLLGAKTLTHLSNMERIFFEFYLFTVLHSRFLSVIYFIHISVYISIPISQFITPPPPPCHFPPLVSIRLFSTSVSLFLPCKLVHLYHFSRFHIHALIYDICFSLFDLLHSVWQSLGPSTSLQMTQFRFFWWLSNIPLYICTTSSLSIRLSMGT